MDKQRTALRNKIQHTGIETIKEPRNQHDKRAVTTSKRRKDSGKDPKGSKTHDDILKSQVLGDRRKWRAEGVWDGSIVINTT